MEARQNTLLHPADDIKIANFPKAKDFAVALSDMCEIEGKLEKKRREIALRTDFNLTDAYKMFI